ncbi:MULTISPECIES: TetR/AcrR family transcriptional regulator [Arthrobacter]|uniref:TetR/AcrR family transcriptional regulator n=1 Tax=Arthrobacter terricola TaxID=2547396 RepID=A0A4R5KKJ3_9MICC|nr:MULTISPECIES: TetR family transcriptional regulator C-terminal domain-containing protein [Arthrobacter]MBT8161324.1 TetR family transcriptional regulator [Arthrobacter sp. GN70]TDF96081.1 TetR/AcrR family transcriptional regulator [Arthrobacter terricola]
MPKIVDHEKRRLELVEATWRIIATRGIEGATMREIATEAGFANGALKPYFPTKDDLLTFAFAHVFNQTNTRMDSATSGLRGLPALRSYCHEILPLDAERLNEARIAIAFWQRALTDPAKSALHDSSMEQWRESLFSKLREARELGELKEGLDDDDLVGAIMTFVLGAQITATLTSEHHSADQLRSQLETYISLISNDVVDAEG